MSNFRGKVKTTVQMIMVIFLIADLGNEFAGAAGAIHVIEMVLIYAAMLLTVISLVDYILKNKDVITTFK